MKRLSNTALESTMTTMLAVLLLFSGCATSDATVRHTSMHRSEIISFRIAFQTDWQVKVSQDGSGTIAYGRSNAAHLPRGSLDFVKWRNQIAGLQWYDSSEWRDTFGLVSEPVVLGVWQSNGMYEAYYVAPDEVPIELFQAAVDATTSERTRELWKKLPLKIMYRWWRTDTAG